MNHYEEGGVPKKRAICRKCNFDTEIARRNIASKLAIHLKSYHLVDYNNAKELRDEENLKRNVSYYEGTKSKYICIYIKCLIFC